MIKNILVQLRILIISITLLSSQAWGQTGTIKLAGLHSPVEVLRDSFGVNHIYASNQHDLFFAQGYCAARDRLFQFEIWRRQATGTTAEVFGRKELRRDVGTRLFTYRGDMQSELKRYHPDGVAIIHAFTEGVNAYIHAALQHPDQLPVEFRLLGIQPQPWTPEVVISRHQGILGNASQELSIARAVAAMGAEKVKALIWFHPRVPDINLDASITAAMLKKDILGPYQAFKRELNLRSNEGESAFNEHGRQQREALSNTDPPLQNILGPTKQFPNEVSSITDPAADALFNSIQQAEPEGSNNWIISGKRTASGFPMLANDPHRKMGLPSLRYIVHLQAPGWNVIGGGEPTIPGVSIGHNEYGAWGLTIFETDAEDLFVYDLDPQDFSRYSFQGRWVQMKEIADTIRVKGEQPFPTIHRYTVHGPVTFIDTANRKAWAIRCAWLEPGGAPYLNSLRIDQAHDWESFRDACTYGHIPGENMIWADKKGNIGWQAVGIIPIRNTHSGYVPVPGDGRFDWQGYLPIRERPHALNPKTGFLATANENVTPTDYKHLNALGSTWSDPFRGDRIREVLATKQNISLEEMGRLQHDYYSLPARQLVPLLKDIAFADVKMMQAKALLLDWDLVLDRSSRAAGLYVIWERELILKANQLFVPDAAKPYFNLQLTPILEQLQQPMINFGAVRQMPTHAFIRTTFETAVQAMHQKFGDNTMNWTYGQPHFKHIRFTHPISADFDLKPIPRGGNGNTPGATGGTDNQTHGASFRILVDTKDWDRTRMINVPGQSGDPKSPYFANLLELWGQDSYFPAYYTRRKIEQVTAEKTLLQPE